MNVFSEVFFAVAFRFCSSKQAAETEGSGFVLVTPL